MNGRIKELRKALGLTQKEFGKRIGVKPNTIATYEIGRNQPIDAVVSLICREFGVSETWLRTGVGEMYQKKTRDEELSSFMNDVLSEEQTGFRWRLVSALSRMNPAQWAALESVLTELAKELPATPAEPDTRPRAEKPVTEWTEADIDAGVEEYRRALLEEKRRAGSGSTSSGPV